LMQGVVGYTQYFNGVPELLVGVHIALATMLWVLTMRVVLFARTTENVKHGPGIARATLANA